jgi:Lon protease-like protein
MFDVPLDFSRPIPLFPLPNFVLFPGIVHPLHIFEERYKAMVADTLRDQRLLGMATLKVGWKCDYAGSPPIHSRVCVGRIIKHVQLEDGRYDLMVQGVCRADVETETSGREYRQGRLTPLPEQPMPAGQEIRVRKVLYELFTNSNLTDSPPAEAIRALLLKQVPIGIVVDALAFGLVPEAFQRQILLEMAAPVPRANHLMDLLVAQARQYTPRSMTSADTNWAANINTN